MTRDGDSDGPDRKERVLHTRIPAVLEHELKRLATNLRVPVSNVVRAILEDAVSVAELAGRKTEAELRGWAERLSDERERLRARISRARAIEEDDQHAGEARMETARSVSGDAPSSSRGVEKSTESERRPGAPGVGFRNSAPGTPRSPDPRNTQRISQGRGEDVGRYRAFVDASSLDDVIGFQPIVLAAATSCAKCGRSLGVGQEAFVAIPARPTANGTKLIIDRDCLPSPPTNE